MLTSYLSFTSAKESQTSGKMSYLYGRISFSFLNKTGNVLLYYCDMFRFFANWKEAGILKQLRSYSIEFRGVPPRIIRFQILRFAILCRIFSGFVLRLQFARASNRIFKVELICGLRKLSAGFHLKTVV